MKKLPSPFKDSVEAGFKMYATERVKVAPGGFKVCEVIHCPVPQKEQCFVNSKAGSGLMFNVFEQSIKTALSTHLASEIRISCQELSSTVKKLETCILKRPLKYLVTFYLLLLLALQIILVLHIFLFLLI